MKKSHVTATSVFLAAMLFLGGCAKQGNEFTPGTETSSDSDISDNVSESNTILDTSNEATDSTSSKSSLLDGLSEEELRQMRIETYGIVEGGGYKFADITPETSWLIDDFRESGIEYTAYDGSAIDLLQASRAYGNQDRTYELRFDFAFLRYAQPVYHTTFEDPNLYDWDTRKFTNDHSIEVARSDFFKVQAGDMLENGLTVKSADYWIDNQGSLCGMGVELSGEITLSGVLTYYNDITGDDILCFIPDLSKAIMAQMSITTGSFYLQNEKFAAILDGVQIDLGYKNNFSTDITDIFKKSSCIEATVTLENLSIEHYDGMNYRNRATLVLVEETKN